MQLMLNCPATYTGQDIIYLVFFITYNWFTRFTQTVATTKTTLGTTNKDGKANSLSFLKGTVHLFG